MKSFCKIKFQLGILLLACNIFFSGLHAQGFLKAEGQKIVNAKGQNILLRGEGLGGWMLQEGYMLGINKDAQQNKIRSRIEDMMGAKETEEFYDAWFTILFKKLILIRCMHGDLILYDCLCIIIYTLCLLTKNR